MLPPSMEDRTPPRPPPGMEGKLQVGWRFFKVMVSGFQTKLNLPPLVCEKLKGDESLQATLVTAKGRWDVGIGHGSQGKLYFERGWDVFVQNHGLRVGEFAVFEYTGGICFNVSLLDKNGSEKVDSELEKDSNLGEDEQNMASKLNPLTQISQDEETVPPQLDSSLNEVADIDQEGEHVDLATVKLEEDEDMITSHINARLAPLYAILAEIDNVDLPSHVNIREEDNDRGQSQENITKDDNNKCHAEQERNKERESSQHNSGFASSAEIGHEKACPSQVKIQEHDVRKVSVKFEVEEDEVPFQTKLQNPRKGRCSVKRRRDDERAPSAVKIQKQDMNRCSTKQKKDDNRAPSQAKIQEHDKSKSSVKHDKNKNGVKQKNHKDQVPSKPKGCAQDKKDVKRKREPKVNISSPEQNLQFSTLMKPYHLRSRSPYMHIPAEFCVANELYQNARITLKGPCDERQVSFKVCKGGKTKYAIITRGWPEFIAGNNLKEGDTCIFKLHRRGSSSGPVVLDVKVVRASA